MSVYRLSAIKGAAISSLYEHLLTAQADSYWFRIEDIRELMKPQPSGALLHIALTSLKNDDELVDITYEGGEDDLFTLTADGIEAAEEVHARFFATESDVLDFSKETGRVQEIRATLDRIEKELRESNEVTNALEGDQKELMTGEIAAAQALTARNKFRLSRLISLLIPMLRHLSDRFAGSAVGELAKRMVALLLS